MKDVIEVLKRDIENLENSRPEMIQQIEDLESKVETLKTLNEKEMKGKNQVIQEKDQVIKDNQKSLKNFHFLIFS
jgi:prefoldin subunit 5